MQTKFLNLLFYKKKILKNAYFSGIFPVNVPLKMMEKVGWNIALQYEFIRVYCIFWRINYIKKYFN